MTLLQKTLVSMWEITKQQINTWSLDFKSISKVCQSARSPAKNVSHYNDLEKCFPENPLLEDDYLNS